MKLSYLDNRIPILETPPPLVNIMAADALATCISSGLFHYYMEANPSLAKPEIQWQFS